MKSKLFQLARESQEAETDDPEVEQPKDLEANLDPIQAPTEDIPIPEEGNMNPPQEGPPDAASMPEEDTTPVDPEVAQPETAPEPAVAEEPPAQEEQPTEPLTNEPATPEVTEEPTDPGEPTEFDPQLQAADDEDSLLVEDAAVLEDNSTAAAAEELQRVVVTLETFAEMIEEGDIDPASQEIISSVMADVQQDFGFPQEPTLAVESLNIWKSDALKQIKVITGGLKHGLSKAKENLNESTLALIDASLSKLPALVTELNEAVQTDAEEDVQINPASYPYLVSGWKSFSPAEGMQWSFGVVSKAFKVAQEISEVSFDVEQLKTIFGKCYELEAVRDGFQVNMTDGMGPRNLMLTVTSTGFKIDTQYYQFARNNDTQVYIERADLKLWLAMAANSIGSLQETLTSLKTAVQNTPEDPADNSTLGLRNALHGACVGVLLRHQLKAYGELLRMNAS